MAVTIRNWRRYQTNYCDCGQACLRCGIHFISLRPASAWPRVTSSVIPVRCRPGSLRDAGTSRRVAQPFRQIVAGRIAFHVGPQGDHDFLDRFLGQPLFKLAIRKSSGSTPFDGEILPPSTWYFPRKDPGFSTVIMSVACSTTQTRPASRWESVQMAQGSGSVKEPQMEQCGCVRGLDEQLRELLVSEASLCTRCSASRSAERGPMPGSLCSARSVAQWFGRGFHCLPGLRIIPGRLNPAVALPISVLEISLACASAWFAASAPCPPVIARRTDSTPADQF